MDEGVASFGPFEFRFQTGELRKHGVRVRLQGKPAQLLRALVEHHGKVVTRDELRDKLWSSDIFVDFESGLNTAANRLRAALGDSAEHPVYIETLPKIGYRFMATVSLVFPPKHTVLSPASLPPVQVELQPEPAQSPAPIPAPVLTARKWLVAWAVAGCALLGCVLLYSFHQSEAAPSFQQVTFSRGFAGTARFAPDGKSIIYGSMQKGGSSRVFLAQRGSPEARMLQKGPAWLAGVSTRGELAMFKSPGAEASGPFVLESTPLQGGTATFLADHASAADWSSEGSLCVVHTGPSGNFINYPKDRTIYRSTGWITNARVSPNGRYVAFLEHLLESDDAGQITVVDSTTGKARPVSTGWGSLSGLAWQPATKEIWFTGARSGVNRTLMAVDLKGNLRQVAQIPGGMILHDIAPNGDVLIARINERLAMFLGNLEDRSREEISLLDWTRAVALSDDGKLLLFDESGEGGGKRYSVYLYNTESHTSERVGEGRALDLSPDGRWALTQEVDDPTRLSLISLSQKKSSTIQGDKMIYQWVKFMPGTECTQIIFGASQPGHPLQIYRQQLPSGKPQPVASHVELSLAIVSGNGFIAGLTPEGEMAVLDLHTFMVRSLDANQYGFPVRFMNEHQLLTARFTDGMLLFHLIDIGTGEGHLYRRFEVTDTTGTAQIHWLHAAENLSQIAYSQRQTLSDLFTVSGWK